MLFRIIFLFLLLVITNLVAFAFDEENCNLIQSKICIDYSERIINDTPTSQCWKYQQKWICDSKEQNNCELFENNRGCRELIGNCLEKSPLGNCKDYEKKFICNSKFDENAEIKHIDTEFNIIKDEKDLSNCSEKEINQHCEFAEEICVEGAETRNIDGKNIYKDCWKWEKKYVCRKVTTNSFIDECSQFKQDKNCKEIARECLYQNLKSNGCEHYEIEYSCTNKEIVRRDCTKQNYCIGDICKEKQRSSHNDFGKSISYLNILAGMKSSDLEGCKCQDGKSSCAQGEINTSSCKFFAGQSNTCRNHTGQFNCCSNKGFLRGVFQCNQMEKDLSQKRSVGLCHHIGSWSGKRLNFYKKFQSHCCFKSKLAKIIQVQGRAQLGIGWGNRKNPDCRALTLDEIKRIDFTKIDFSEAFGEFESQYQTKIETTKNNILGRTESLKDSMNQELMIKKMQEFYKRGEE